MAKDSAPTRLPSPPNAAVPALAGAVLLVAAAAFAAWASLPRGPAFGAAIHGLAVAGAIAAGVLLLGEQVGRRRRFGWLVLVAGLILAPTLLAESSNSVLYSLGRAEAWPAAAALVCVVLAYPSGRLSQRIDRVLAAAMGVAVVIAMPTALLVDQFALPSPWSACDDSCPSNALMAVSSEPHFVGAVLAPLSGGSVLALCAAVPLSLARRAARGSRLTRAGLIPVVAIAATQATVVTAFVLVRGLAPGSHLADVLAVAILIGITAFAAFFAAAPFRARRSARRALGELVARSSGQPDRARLRDAIATAVNDPSLDLAFRDSEAPAGWVDVDGLPFAPGRPSPGRSMTEVRGPTGLVALLIHDAGLEDMPVMDEVACGFTLMALDNADLELRLRASLRELRASRLRILSAADRERRRIERDLHDGAQQRLVGLGIQLELAADLAVADPTRAAERMRELAREVDDAVDEVRALARGLLPPLLVERGIGDALREAAASSSVPVTVRAVPAGRYPLEIEMAVYFCCLEALQNAAKHAAGATCVTVGVWEKGALEFEIRDDGPGLPAGALERGAGLTNMRDRVAAVGGRLSITGALGRGTRVAGAVPLALAELPEQAETLVRGATDALEDGFAIYRSVRDEAGTVVDFLVEYLNDAACAQLGRDREQLMGRTLAGVDHDFTASTDFRWLRQVLAWDHRDTRTAVEYERGPGAARLIRRATELRAAPLGEGRLVVTWRDMTEEARAREELRRSDRHHVPAPSPHALPGVFRR